MRIRWKGMSAVAVCIVCAARGEPLIPIAQWDAVPAQRVTTAEPLNLGVVAFSKAGIDRVTFTFTPAAGGPTYIGPERTVRDMTVNPQNGVCEYWTTVSVHDFSGNGRITAEVSVHGLDGGIRDKNTGGGGVGLDPLRLTIDKSGTYYRPRDYWVSNDGIDGPPNDGTEDKPYASIGVAMQAMAENSFSCDGGSIYVKPGTYMADCIPGWETYTASAAEWLTITTGGGDANNTIIAGTLNGWPRIYPAGAHIRFKGLTIRQPGASQDPTIGWTQEYAGRVRVWFDACRLEGAGRYTGSNVHPVQPMQYFDEAYVTDTTIEDVGAAVCGARLCRGLDVQTISDDAFQNVRLVVDCRVHDIDPWPLSPDFPHADLWQHYGGHATNKWDDNVIVYGLIGTGLKYQGLFIRPYTGTCPSEPSSSLPRSIRVPSSFIRSNAVRSSLPPNVPQSPAQGMAFVNVYVRMDHSLAAPPDWVGASDFSRSVDHLLWWHCTFRSAAGRSQGITVWPDEAYFVNDACDVAEYPYTISNMSVVGCDFARLGGCQPIADTSGFKHNHFVSVGGGDLALGTDYTAGIDLLDHDGVPCGPVAGYGCPGFFSSPLLDRFSPITPADANGYLRTNRTDVGAFQRCIDVDGDNWPDCTYPCPAGLEPNCLHADADGDGDADATDFASLQRCLQSDIAPLNRDCKRFDFNNDNRIDQLELWQFATTARGPANPWPPAP